MKDERKSNSGMMTCRNGWLFLQFVCWMSSNPCQILELEIILPAQLHENPTHSLFVRFVRFVV